MDFGLLEAWDIYTSSEQFSPTAKHKDVNSGLHWPCLGHPP